MIRLGMIRLGLLLILASLAVACRGSEPSISRQPVPVVAIAPDVQLVLPRPAELGRTIDAVQQVMARREGGTHIFEVRLQADGHRVRLVGTDPAGRRAMTIDWREDLLVVERAPWLPEAVRPENILADLVLAYWPDAALRRVLAGTRLSLTGGPDERVVRRDGNELVAVRYDGNRDPFSGAVRLRNTAWGYELDINSVIVSP
jgi:hypothetical protein